MAMVVSFVRLQDLVEAFIQERPEVVKRAIVSHAFTNVG
jgi:hypothetical protein